MSPVDPRRIWLTAALLGVACGGGQTTASKSAAAFDQNPRQVERGHGHGDHGRTSEPSSAPPAAAGDAHEHAPGAGAEHRADHAAGAQPQRAQGTPTTHAGHATTGTVAQTPVPAADKADPHAGHASSARPSMPSEQSTAGVVPGHAASQLESDSLDSPAPTSMEEAARAAAIANGMAGSAHHMSPGHYSHVDAGRPSPSPSPKKDER